MWEKKIILRTDLVEISKINTDSHIAVFLGNRDDISQPLRILDYR